MMSGHELATAVQYGARRSSCSSSTTACTGRSACTRSGTSRPRRRAPTSSTRTSSRYARVVRRHAATGRADRGRSRRRSRRRSRAGRPALLELRVDPEAITPRATLSQIRGRRVASRSCASCSARRPTSPPTSSRACPTGPSSRASSVDELRARLGGPVPDGPTDPREVVRELAAVGDARRGRDPGRALLRLRDRGRRARGARRRLARPRPGTRTPACTSPARPPSVVEEMAGAWLADLLGLPRARRSPSSPARRWRTRPRWPRRVTTSSPRWAGTSSATA